MIYYSNSPKETRKIASNLAAKTKRGIIALEGELGAGKTTFAQAFIKALRVKNKAKSPTFNIIKKYKVPKKDVTIYHIDCYRLKDHNEAVLLGIKEILREKNSIVLIEWPERIKKIIPKKLIRIHIDHIEKNIRKITLKR